MVEALRKILLHELNEGKLYKFIQWLIRELGFKNFLCHIVERIPDFMSKVKEVSYTNGSASFCLRHLIKLLFFSRSTSEKSSRASESAFDMDTTQEDHKPTPRSHKRKSTAAAVPPPPKKEEELAAPTLTPLQQLEVAFI